MKKGVCEELRVTPGKGGAQPLNNQTNNPYNPIGQGLLTFLDTPSRAQGLGADIVMQLYNYLKALRA